MLLVVPAKSSSRRVPNKNHRPFRAGKSLTQLAIEFAGKFGDVVLVSDKYYPGCKILCYPRWALGEVDNSIDIWRYGIGDYDGMTALIEPSCYRRTTDSFRRAIDLFNGTTAVAVALSHRCGIKAFVFAPTGEFYLATANSVRDGSVFDGKLSCVLSDAKNIDTEEDIDELHKL